MITYTQDELRQQYDNLSVEEKQRETTTYKILSSIGLGELAVSLGMSKYETIGFDKWTSEQGYSSVRGNNDVNYYYLNQDWDSGGDVITRDGTSYIHHDPSYTLLTLPGEEGGTANTHSFEYSFDPRGVLNSEYIDPSVARATRKLVATYHIEDRNNSLYVFEGYRSPETQQRYYEQGRTRPGNIITNVKPYGSWHQYGMAVDIVFQNSRGGPTWSKSSASWNRLGRIGQEVGFEWGGSWTKFKDKPHFQMVGSFTSWRGAYGIYSQYANAGRNVALSHVWRARSLGYSNWQEYSQYLTNFIP